MSKRDFKRVIKWVIEEYEGLDRNWELQVFWYLIVFLFLLILMVALLVSF